MTAGETDAESSANGLLVNIARRFLDSPSGRNLEEVDADEGIFLQIVFKGLAGFGDKVESVLESGIRGYRTETDDG